MKKLLSLIVICMIATLSISVNSNAAMSLNELNQEKISKLGVISETNQFDKEGTMHLTDKVEIKKYLESEKIIHIIHRLLLETFPILPGISNGRKLCYNTACS